MDEQQRQLDRVTTKIAARILAFVEDRLRTGRVEFHAGQLREYVAAVHPSAPASADRVMRSLRQQGAISYVLVSRSRSLYRVIAVGQERAA